MGSCAEAGKEEPEDGEGGRQPFLDLGVRVTFVIEWYMCGVLSRRSMHHL